MFDGILKYFITETKVASFWRGIFKVASGVLGTIGVEAAQANSIIEAAVALATALTLYLIGQYSSNKAKS